MQKKLVSFMRTRLTKMTKMTKISGIFILFSLSLSLTQLNAGKYPYEIKGIITKITDGDTLFKIRLSDIDAPENKQSYYKESKDYLSTVCLNKNAYIKVTGTDLYSRKIGRLFCNNFDMNKAQVQYGFAWFYKKYSKDKELENLQNQAKSRKIGLWQEDNPVSPEQFRNLKKQK